VALALEALVVFEVFSVVDLDVLVFVAFVVVGAPETMAPAALQGKSRLAVLAMFVQKYSELPLVPTR